MLKRHKQISNRGVRFAKGATGPYARKLSAKAQARSVVLGVKKNLANDYIKNFDNWTSSPNVIATNGDFFGRTNVWTLTNTNTSGITMVYDFAEKQAAGGPVLEVGENYRISVDMYSPSTNAQSRVGQWYTTDMIGATAGPTAEDVWQNIEAVLTPFNTGDDLLANALSRFTGVSSGDQAVYDLKTMVIVKTPN